MQEMNSYQEKHPIYRKYNSYLVKRKDKIKFQEH